MIYCIDLDNTICRTRGTDYESSVPITEAVEKVNALFDAGHTIKIYTGRGSRSGRDWTGLTHRQLVKWGVKFHELLFGKPSYEVWIDDKAINSESWLNGQDEV